MKISFESQGQKISGNFLEGRSNKPAFLFIQGWTGNQNLMAAETLAKAGYAALTYDMRGHGDSEGDLAALSRADFVDDSVLAYDFLKAQTGATTIGVVGSSFGGYTAIQLSTRRPATCLSLRVPANYPDAGFDEPQLPQVNNQASKEFWQKPLAFDRNNTLAALHRFTGPIQIIEAENDETIPHRTLANFVEAVSNQAQLSYHIMKNAPHSLINESLKHEYRDLLLEWVDRAPIDTPDSDPSQ
jgi:pimeloyl-ACP methyl ester carboxylesterase